LQKKIFYAEPHMTETAVVVQKAYEWSLWILPKVEKFPKSFRFSLGQNLVDTSLDLLMHLVDATYQTRKSNALAAAVGKVNRARYLVRLAKDLQMLNLNGYEFSFCRTRARRSRCQARRPKFQRVPICLATRSRALCAPRAR